MQENTIIQDDLAINEALKLEKEKIASKKVNLSQKTLKRLEIMYPVYLENTNSQTKEIEKISSLIEIAIENLFKTDYLKRVGEL